MLVVVVEDKGAGQRENERGVGENEGQKRKRGRRTSVGLQSMQRGGKPEYMKKTRRERQVETREGNDGEAKFGPRVSVCVCVSNERQKWSGAFLCVAFLGCKPHGLGAMNECLCLPACLPACGKNVCALIAAQTRDCLFRSAEF
jgi:hypothetical protein